MYIIFLSICSAPWGIQYRGERVLCSRSEYHPMPHLECWKGPSHGEMRPSSALACVVIGDESCCLDSHMLPTYAWRFVPRIIQGFTWVPKFEVIVKTWILLPPTDLYSFITYWYHFWFHTRGWYKLWNSGEAIYILLTEKWGFKHFPYALHNKQTVYIPYTYIQLIYTINFQLYIYRFSVRTRNHRLFFWRKEGEVFCGALIKRMRTRMIF